jgi:hypothetical protein
VALFCGQGARVHDYSKEDPKYSLHFSSLKNINMWYPRLNNFITVFKNEAEHPKGAWAHVRLSWGISPEEFEHNENSS